MCIFNQKKYIRSNMKVNLNQNQSNFCLNVSNLAWAGCHHLSSTLDLFYFLLLQLDFNWKWFTTQQRCLACCFKHVLFLSN